MKVLKVLSWLVVALQVFLLVIGIVASFHLFTIIWICLDLIFCIAMAVFVSTY